MSNLAKNQPRLIYAHPWSSPVSGVSDQCLIAMVLENPGFEDVLECCLFYGIDKVEGLFFQMKEAGEIPAPAQNALDRMFRNIRTAQANVASRNEKAV